MAIQQMLLGGGVNYASVDSADFDGTNDWMTKSSSITGIADGKKGVLSFWFRIDGSDGSELTVFGGINTAATERISCFRTTGNKWQLECQNSSGTNILRLNSSLSYTASATWHHFLASWDLSTVGARYIYIDDAADLSVATFTDDTIDYDMANPLWLVGAITSGGAFKFDGCLAELYFDAANFLDLSVTSNRRNFISANLKPVFLGVDGSLPTATTPSVYQHLGKGETVSNFATNRSGNGNFTITGTLTTGSTSPSG